MSLVDYASSSDEEEEAKQVKEEEENKDPKQSESPLPPPQDSQNHQKLPCNKAIVKINSTLCPLLKNQQHICFISYDSLIQDSVLPSSTTWKRCSLSCFLVLQKRSVITSSFQQSNTSSHSSDPSIEKLPDASMLLNSPTFSSHQMSSDDHYSRVAAAMAESASRKRESNGSMLPPRSKLPKGNLPYSRKMPVPDTVGGLLVPPQLRGRSNVVTEDIGKLFVSRHADTKG